MSICVKIATVCEEKVLMGCLGGLSAVLESGLEGHGLASSAVEPNQKILSRNTPEMCWPLIDAEAA